MQPGTRSWRMRPVVPMGDLFALRKFASQGASRPGVFLGRSRGKLHLLRNSCRSLRVNFPLVPRCLGLRPYGSREVPRLRERDLGCGSGQRRMREADGCSRVALVLGQPPTATIVRCTGATVGAEIMVGAATVARPTGIRICWGGSPCRVVPHDAGHDLHHG
jgi:hypothetical protein